MKKFFKKIEKNKILFSIFMLICFLIFEFFIDGLYGYVIPGFEGILGFIGNNIYITDSGQHLMSEVFIAVCIMPVLIIFKNTYIFHQKVISFKNRMKLIWPFLLEIFVIFVTTFISVGGFKYFNLKEVLISVVLFIFVGIFEEFLCRGWLLNEFLERFSSNKKGVFFSLLMSSLIFGFMHVTNIITMGQSVDQTIVQIIMACFMGMGLGAIYLRTNNIWTVVFLHFFYDFSINMVNMNITTSCFAHQEQLLSFQLIISLLLNIAITAPAWLCIFDVFSERSIKNVTGENYTADVKIHPVALPVKLSIAGLICLIQIASVFAGPNIDSCMLYPSEKVDEYTIISSTVKNYNIELTDNLILENNTLEENNTVVDNYNLALTYDETGLLIKLNDSTLKYDFENIANLYVINKNGKYLVAFLVSYADGGVVYYSDYVTLDNIKDADFMKKFKKSFTKLEIPSVIKIGSIKMKNDEYLLFQTEYTSNYYINDKNELVALELEVE